MGNKYYESGAIKEKFALLLAKLHEGGLLTEYINKVIVESPFFDCFEKNDIEDFMSLSFETIAKNVFGEEIAFDYKSDYASEYYWAGMTIMDILMNCHVPLKRILIVYPLSSFISSFDPYHQMHMKYFYEHYLQIEKQTSVLRRLREDKGIQLSKIALLTGLNLATLRLFDKSNSALFATSFSNVSKLANLLKVNVDVFKEESTFQPVNLSMLQNKEFKEIFLNLLVSYFYVEKKTKRLVIDGFLENKEIRNLLKEWELLIDISDPVGVIYSSLNRVCSKYLRDVELRFIYRKAVDSFLEGKDSLFY